MDNSNKSQVDVEEIHSMLHDSKPVLKQKHPTHKKVKTAVALLLMVLITAGGVLVSSRKSDEPDTSVSQSEVTTAPLLSASLGYTEGLIQTSLDQKTWNDASNGDALRQGHYVRTGPQGKAILLLNDRSALRLDASSVAHIDKLSDEQVEISLLAGQVYARVIDNPDRTFSIVTASDTYTALGTAFRVSSGTTDILEVYQSKVSVMSIGLKVTEGNSYDSIDQKITKLDLTALLSDEFIEWNKIRDSLKSEYSGSLGVLQAPSEIDQIVENPERGNEDIVLHGSAIESGIYLRWTAPSVAASNGYKIIFSDKTDSPVYGEHKSIYVQNGEASEWVVEVSDGKTYNFRVCVYDGSDNCSSYSNTAVVAAPSSEVDAIVNGPLTLSITSAVKLSWATGGTAPHGYKVVMSLDQNPTYPEDSVQYTQDTLIDIPFKEPYGTYYIRVCKYVPNDVDGASCVDYSNQVEFTTAASM